MIIELLYGYCLTLLPLENSGYFTFLINIVSYQNQFPALISYSLKFAHQLWQVKAIKLARIIFP